MIRLSDAFLLARTKLRLRLVRLSVSLVISALLFAVLVFASIVLTGAIASFLSFQKEGYGGRFLVKATPYTYNNFGGPNDTELSSHFLAVQTDLIAQKKAAAKKLNISYDSTADQSLPMTETKLPNGSIERYINPSSPLVIAYTSQLNSQKKEISFESFQKAAHAFHATNFYQSTAQSFMTFSGQPSMQVLANGKEDYTGLTTNSYSNGPPTGIASLTSLGWLQFDDKLLEPFLLDGQNLAVGTDGSVPVIAPLSAAEEIAGYKSLPQTATAAQKLERLRQIRKQVAGKTATICYRNAVSNTLLQEAVSQQKQIEQNKGKKDYQPPSLQYQLPSVPCGEVTVKKDLRTADEKTTAANEKSFKKQFGEVVDPEQEIVTVRVVGITSEPSYSPSVNASALASSILQSSLGSGWFSPVQPMASNQYIKEAGYSGAYDTLPLSQQAFYAEFASLADEQAFIKAMACDAQVQNGPPAAGFDPCVKKGKPFVVVAYGNNAGAIEDFKHGVWKIGQFVVLGIVVLASLILMGNVGKIIADSRRETAVFRALGAKRFDIAQIYLTYSFIIATIVYLIAGVIGVLAAFYLNTRMSPSMSVAAVLAYNAKDTSKQFTFYGLDLWQMLLIFGLVICAATISTVIPLFGNLRRNPIKDMRDEG